MDEIIKIMKENPGKTLYVTHQGIYALKPTKQEILALITPITNSFGVQIGWYRLKDGTFTQFPDKKQKPEGVVAYLRNGKAHSISLTEKKLSISPNGWSLSIRLPETCNPSDGQANTSRFLYCLRDFERNHMIEESPVFDWCDSNGGYLPADEQWQQIAENFEIINQSIKAVKGQPLQENVNYMSSTQIVYSKKEDCLYTNAVKLPQGEITSRCLLVYKEHPVRYVIP